MLNIQTLLMLLHMTNKWLPVHVGYWNYIW